MNKSQQIIPLTLQTKLRDSVKHTRGSVVVEHSPVTVEPVGVCFAVRIRGALACVRPDLASAERTATQLLNVLGSTI